jgi:hypothetical protein
MYYVLHCNDKHVYSTFQKESLSMLELQVNMNSNGLKYLVSAYLTKCDRKFFVKNEEVCITAYHNHNSQCTNTKIE